MIGEFIPDTSTVMATYSTVATYRQSPDLGRQAAFKAWLAEHDRQVAAKAWQDGYSTGQSDANPWGSTYPATTPNPHEEVRHVDQ